MMRRSSNRPSKPGPPGEGGGLHEREGRVLLQGDGALDFEGAEDVDDADAGDDDGVAGEDADVGDGAGGGVAAEIDDDGLVDAGAVDGDDVAGGEREVSGCGEDVEQPALAGDGDDGVRLADYGDDWLAASVTGW